MTSRLLVNASPVAVSSSRFSPSHKRFWTCVFRSAVPLFPLFSVLHGAAEKRAALCVPFWRGTVINLEPEKMTASGWAALRNLMLALNVLTGSLVVWT